jgi:hypothetical protein
MAKLNEIELARARVRDVTQARHVGSVAVRCRTCTPRRACDCWFEHRALEPVCDTREPHGRCHTPRSHTPDGRSASRRWSPPTACRRTHAEPMSVTML